MKVDEEVDRDVGADEDKAEETDRLVREDGGSERERVGRVAREGVQRERTNADGEGGAVRLEQGGAVVLDEVHGSGAVVVGDRDRVLHRRRLGVGLVQFEGGDDRVAADGDAAERERRSEQDAERHREGVLVKGKEQMSEQGFYSPRSMGGTSMRARTLDACAYPRRVAGVGLVSPIILTQ